MHKSQCINTKTITNARNIRKIHLKFNNSARIDTNESEIDEILHKEFKE
jgi:hypothetical protein